MLPPSDDDALMSRAIELARRGEGCVEPNPMVGALVVDDQRRVLGEGWHERFGGPHAEINAFARAGTRTAGATLFVTLEPCSHTRKKTPPCADAVIAAGIRRVVIGTRDPNPQVDGGGIAKLRAAGIEVEVGLLEEECRALIAPFAKRVTTGLPFVHGKWAMTLDGKLATRTGSSQWISNETSRAVVHRLRGRMDAILVGRRTAELDNPRLTARPAGPRVATRIVLDSRATLSLDSLLLRTLDEAPLMVVVGDSAPRERVEALRAAGAEVLSLPPDEGAATGEPPLRPGLRFLLQELGRRQFTNLLVEGGGEALGDFLDAGLLDELHVFIAPKVAGGRAALPPVAGLGVAEMSHALRLQSPRIEILDGDIYVNGRIARPDAQPQNV